MPQEPKPSRGFAARIMGLQFAVVGLMILAAAAGAMWVTVERVNEQAQERALAIARTLAADPEIRAQVKGHADDDNSLDAAALRAGYVQRAAEAARTRTGAFFVVVTEDRGIRLAHPTESLLGQRVSTDPVALSGQESVSREHGTLGESVRAKVPVFAPASDTVVGEVSVGVGIQELAARLRVAGFWVLGLGLAALGLSAASTRWLVRRLKAQTLGLEPAEIDRKSVV